MPHESLIQLGENGVGDLVTFMLKGFDNLHLGDTCVVGEHFEQGVGPFVDVGGLLGKEIEETLFARQEALQKSRHVA